MSDTFNPECPNCKVTIQRIEQWIDNVHITPKKHQRYMMLLEFVSMLPNECFSEDDELRNKETLRWIGETANNLLKEMKEDEILRSNGFA